MKIKNQIKIKQILLSFVTFILLTVGVTSCDDVTDDFLDVENTNEIDLEIKDLRDSDLALNGVYNTILNDNTFSPILFGMLSDEVSLGGNRVPGGTLDLNIRLLNTTNHTFTNSLPEINANYSALYRGILQANYTIDGLQNIEESLSSDEDIRTWTRQMAEARFFRGLFYYFLRWTYNEGNLILIKNFSVRAQDAVARGLSTAEEVMEFYVADLQYAIDNLATRFIRDGAPVVSGRVTQAAAIMLMANHHLYNNEYPQAIPLYRRLVGEAGVGDFGHTLADPRIMFREEGELNSESIFEVVYDAEALPQVDVFQHVTPNSMLASFTSFVGSFNPPFLPASWLISEYQEERMDLTNEELNRVEVEQPNGTIETVNRTISRRASAMIATMLDEHTPFYLRNTVAEFANGNGPFAANNSRAYGALFKKYNNHDIVRSEDDEPVGVSNQRLRSSKNVAFLRLSEAYINLAECLIKTNDVPGAIEQLNVIRRRWGLELLGPDLGDGSTYNGTVYTNETLMQQLMFTDKPLELSAEGLATRYIDLRRWNENGEINTGAERFRFLSTQQFAFRDYVPRIVNVGTRFESVLVKFPFEENNPLDPFPPSALIPQLRRGGRRIVHSEFELTSQNYQGYLPLPFTEVEFNNNL